MGRAQVRNIHIHGTHQPGQRTVIPIRPFSLFRRNYFVLVNFRDGGKHSLDAPFPRLNWWVVTALLAFPPWTPPHRCAPSREEAAEAAEAGLRRFLAMLDEHGGA